MASTYALTTTSNCSELRLHDLFAGYNEPDIGIPGANIVCTNVRVRHGNVDDDVLSFSLGPDEEGTSYVIDGNDLVIDTAILGCGANALCDGVYTVMVEIKYELQGTEYTINTQSCVALLCRLHCQLLNMLDEALRCPPGDDPCAAQLPSLELHLLAQAIVDATNCDACCQAVDIYDYMKGCYDYTRNCPSCG